MKTNVQPKPLRLCESTSSRSFWQWPLWLHFQFGMPVQTMRQPLKAVARQAALAFRANSHTVAVNSRLYLAIVFMLVLAPLTNVGYQLLDSSHVIEGWYYVNYYYLLYVLAPWVSLAMFSTGIFLLFPQGSKRAWFLTVPLTSAIVKILWLLTITSNQEFHQVVPMYFILPAAAVALVWLCLFDWLMARKYHKHDGIIASIKGLLRIGAPVATIEKQLDELAGFHSKY